MKVLAGFVLIYGALLGASYVPALVEFTPGLLTPGTTVTRLEYDPTTTTAQDVERLAKHGCHQIPFWMRPVANFPTTTRVVVESDGERLGSFLVRCKDLQVIRTSTPDEGPTIR